MSSQVSNRFAHLFGALGVVLFLAGSLVIRLAATEGGKTVAGQVQDPARVELSELEIPCWSCPFSKAWPIEFQTDLDLIAPLGDGSANAGEWLAEFSEGGRRYGEAQSALGRRIQASPDIGMIFPFEEPLLAEAAGWTEQARLSLYPEVFSLKGHRTRLPNVMFVMTLLRTWWARGLEAEDPNEALEDFRRAIRLGRLLRQDDVVVMVDFLGMSSIHVGTRGLFESAIERGDLETALLASVVIGEVAGQKARVKKYLSRCDLVGVVSGGGTIDQPRMDAVIETARSALDRRHRLDAMNNLHFAASLADPDLSSQARELLAEMSRLEEPVISKMARYCLENPTSYEELVAPAH